MSTLTPSYMLHAELPADLRRRVEAYCRQAGATKSAVTRLALEEFLSARLETPAEKESPK